jgi:hypothetical protein
MENVNLTKLNKKLKTLTLLGEIMGVLGGVEMIIKFNKLELNLTYIQELKDRVEQLTKELSSDDN